MWETYADPAQPLTAAGEERDDLDHDLSDLSVRGVKLAAWGLGNGFPSHHEVFPVTYFLPKQGPQPCC